MSDSTGKGHFEKAYSLETKEQTKAHYSTWADSYDQEVGEENAYAQPMRAAEMLERFLPSPEIRILDAECGSGLSGVALKSEGYNEIDGCDFTPQMLAKAAEKNCYRRLFEADLNAGQADIPDQTYDAITCVGVFSFGHVFPDACDDLIRILKPQGLLIIALNEEYWNKGDLREKIDGMIADGTVVEHAREFGDHLPGHNVMGWVIALERQ